MTIWDPNEQVGMGFEGPPAGEYYAHAYYLVGQYLAKYAELKKMPSADSLDRLGEFSLLHCEIILFACMTVEACLNYIGFLMVGHEYFTKNIERRSIRQKAILLFGLIQQERIDNADQLAKDISLLFSRRNDLVHPKCSPIKADKKPRLHELFYEHEPDPTLIKNYMTAFERILDRLATLIGTRERMDIPNNTLHAYF